MLVRTMDHFAVGRTLTRHAARGTRCALRSNLNQPASIAQVRHGLQTVAAGLNAPPAALIDP